MQNVPPMGNHKTNGRTPTDDSEPSAERFGQGQSGYGAGRLGEDRSLGIMNRNQTGPADRQAFGTDDRYRGRGGEGYWEGRGDRPFTPPQQGAQGGYGSHREPGPGDERTGWGDAQRSGYNSGYARMTAAPGPHRGKGPAGYQRSDDRIRELVCEALSDDEHIDASTIEVAVTGGEVTLTGTAPDRRTKRMAEDCVERVAGVRDVHNQLKVST